MKKVMLISVFCFALFLSSCATQRSADDWHETDYDIAMLSLDAYAEYLKTAELPQNFHYASAFEIFGDFERYYRRKDSTTGCQYSCDFCYFYEFRDSNDWVICVEVHSSTYPPTLNGRRLESIPSGSTSMRCLKWDFDGMGNDYYRGFLRYRYYPSGNLKKIDWREDNVWIEISTYQHRQDNEIYHTEDYPEQGENTMIQRLLSLDDAVAMDAWDELKTHIRENNKKPID